MSAPKVQSVCLDLQSRDVGLLLGLFESRVMTAAHVAALYFDGKKEAAKKRLQKLKAAGFLGERTRLVNEPAVLFLTRKALVVLYDRGDLSQYVQLEFGSFYKRARVSDLTLQHELAVIDVKAAFHSAIAKTESLSIPEFSTWPLLTQFRATRNGYGGAEVTVKPDGFIRIHEKEQDGGLSHVLS